MLYETTVEKRTLDLIKQLSTDEKMRLIYPKTAATAQGN